MTPDIALWAIGILCSFIGALLLIILSRVLRQGDKTGEKVDVLGSDVVAIKLTLGEGESGLVGKVNRLHAARNREQAERLQEEVMENAELKKQLSELRARHAD